MERTFVLLSSPFLGPATTVFLDAVLPPAGRLAWTDGLRLLRDSVSELRDDQVLLLHSG